MTGHPPRRSSTHPNRAITIKLNPSTTLRALWLGLLLLLCGSLPLRAEQFGQFGLFTYQVFDGPYVVIAGYPQDATGPVEIPATIAGMPVIGIGGETSPQSYRGAFSGCTSLSRVVFLGNAPTTGYGAFTNAAPGFTIYYLSSRTGFTSPTWTVINMIWRESGPFSGEWVPQYDNYLAIRINETTYPAAAWLLGHGLWYDTALQNDPDGDGVDLFLTWALNLDPTRPQQSQMPAPVLTANTLSLTFSATRPGLIYRAETSTDLTQWTTAGVTQSAPGPDGRSTATIPLDAPRRFLRLTVE